MVSDEDRDRFDGLVERVMAELPQHLASAFDSIPLIIEDQPEDDLVHQLRIDFESPDDDFDDLCGLHTGRMVTERSVEESGELPEAIHLFRRGILDLSGGFEQMDGVARVETEIRTTLLHELGHHFGLEEDDLEQLGYA